MITSEPFSTSYSAPSTSILIRPIASSLISVTLSKHTVFTIVLKPFVTLLKLGLIANPPIFHDCEENSISPSLEYAAKF